MFIFLQHYSLVCLCFLIIIFCFVLVLVPLRRVPVPDSRYDWLCDHWKPASTIPAYLHVVDIAGLVKGAHEGQVSDTAYSLLTGLQHMLTKDLVILDLIMLLCMINSSCCV